MKAIIKVCSAAKEFTQDQKAIIKRVGMVLIEHNLSVDIRFKKKETLEIPINPQLKIV
jgi:hypothetical protein